VKIDGGHGRGYFRLQQEGSILCNNFSAVCRRNESENFSVTDVIAVFDGQTREQ